MATQDSTTETLEIIRLLEEIVRTFADGCTRPDHRIAIYEKYIELRQTHDVRLVQGRLIVITGGAPKQSCRLPRCKSQVKAVAAKPNVQTTNESPGSLPHCAQ
jgi:hypothetical protein